MVALLSSGVLVILLILLAVEGIGYYSNANGTQGGAEVTVFVTPGSSLDSLSPVLVQRGVISSTLDFRIYLQLNTVPNLQPGIYYFQRGESYAKVLARIKQGPSAVKLTVIPGEVLTQISQQVSAILTDHTAADFTAAALPSAVVSTFVPKGAISLEGVLYPDTYFVNPLESDRQVVQTMLDREDQILDSLNMKPTGTYNGLTAYQVIIAASIVEKEASSATDMPRVARVILNRLAQGMNLQMDSTVRYATKNFSSPITATQLQIASPWNTYVTPGLPPTPISAPSSAALSAVLNPSVGSWLYFVTLKGHTSDSFFNTYAEFQAAIGAAGGVA